jgi:NADPH-dependent curcumin reductase CurA
VLGFLIVDYHARRSDAIAQIVQWVKDGRLQLPRTVSDVPFEQVPEVWQRLFQEGPGGVGKEIVKVLW